MRRFHHSQFSDVSQLARRKEETGQRISICIPTLNEAETIGPIVAAIRTELVDRVQLVDEILVIDSDSTDQTLAIAAGEGARALRSSEIAPETGSHTGKGENLWKALHASSADLICYIDGDVSNFHAGFVTGLLGPLLEFPEVGYVKAHYQRPLDCGGTSHSNGGGRVSEILVKPLLSLFYPELCGIMQPLSGEYAARRSLLESLAFPIGYGVEIAHLIDLSQAGMLDCLAQCDLEKRVHRNRTDHELGDTAFAILQVMLRRLDRDHKLSLTSVLPALHQRWIEDEGDGPQWVVRSIPEPERPPLRGAAIGSL